MMIVHIYKNNTDYTDKDIKYLILLEVFQFPDIKKCRKGGGEGKGEGDVKLREGVAYCLHRKVVVVGGMEGITKRVFN